MAHHMVGHAPHHVQQSGFARVLGKGHGRLDHVPGAVQLVRFLQVRPAPARLLDGEKGVQVAVRMLRLSDEGDGFVHALFKLRIRPDAQGVGGGFQPFGHVAVLEHHAVKRALAASGGQLPRGHLEVFKRVAFFSALDPVPQDRLLVGDHLADHEILVAVHKPGEGSEAVQRIHAKNSYRFAQ